MSERAVALVTGGAKRVGRAIALRLARRGMHVIITYRESEAEARGVVAEIAAAGGSGQCERLELNDLGAVDAFGRGLSRSLSRLDVLVHNASLYEPEPLLETSAEHVLEQYRVNAAGPLVLTARLAGILTASKVPGGSAVVAMGDMHALGRPRREMAAYAMSKAALHEMVRTLAREMAPYTRVNAVAPGVVGFPESGPESDPKMQAAYLSRVPLQRAGTPGDAAAVVEWLALEALYVTGEIVRVDGGRWLA